MPITKEFSTIRHITILVPDTFLRKMIVVSTVFNTLQKRGETATKQIEGLNCFEINEDEDIHSGFKPVKKHSNYKQALRFHHEYCNQQKYIDATRVKKVRSWKEARRK